MTHGTPTGYRWHRCHCRPCRKAHAAQIRRETAARAARLAADPSLAPHGSANTYRNWLCRCRPCTAANSARNLPRQRRWRATGTSTLPLEAYLP